MKKFILNFLFISLSLALIPFQSFAMDATDTELLENDTTVTLVEGKVKRYDEDTHTVLLTLKDGEKISIIIDWNTSLIGYESPNDIKRGQKVKIWYSNTAQQPTAIKIEKKMILGC